MDTGRREGDAMSRPEHPQDGMEQEAEHFTGGPGVVATRSQARGGVAGSLIGGLIGAVIGAIIGAMVFEGTKGLIIGAVVVAVAGATAGGVSGGVAATDKNVTGGDADA